jgi:hypothetical protein
MRVRVWEAVCVLFIGLAITNAFCIWPASTALAQTTSPFSSPSSWTGVWQGELDGQPSVVLTLATDDGTLQGTLVLNGISREGGTPHISVREAHVLLHPKMNGMTLSFEVKRMRGSERAMDFTVERTSDGGAKIHCLSCGDDAPIVEITKQD